MGDVRMTYPIDLLGYKWQSQYVLVRESDGVTFEWCHGPSWSAASGHLGVLVTGLSGDGQGLCVPPEVFEALLEAWRSKEIIPVPEGWSWITGGLSSPYPQPPKPPHLYWLTPAGIVTNYIQIPGRLAAELNHASGVVRLSAGLQKRFRKEVQGFIPLFAHVNLQKAQVN